MVNRINLQSINSWKIKLYISYMAEKDLIPSVAHVYDQLSGPLVPGAALLGPCIRIHRQYRGLLCGTLI